MRLGMILCGVALAGVAHATTFDFAPDDPATDPAVSFTLIGAPDYSYAGVEADWYDVPSVENGVQVTLERVSVYPDSEGGGLEVLSPSNPRGPEYNLEGVTLYAGPESGPVFVPGSYVLENDDGRYVTLTVSSGVPEPGAWAAMLLGFAWIGAWARRVRGAASAREVQLGCD